MPKEQRKLPLRRHFEFFLLTIEFEAPETKTTDSRRPPNDPHNGEPPSQARSNGHRRAGRAPIQAPRQQCPVPHAPSAGVWYKSNMLPEPASEHRMTPVQSLEEATDGTTPALAGVLIKKHETAK
ncbi:hypothetical protein BS47DRAFT_1368255 [Hydnum rufescens UP504]|uniref:Uncharacterized protein n=1 Tax=Hydnum rufescens UP504 TaxID=1448309 RepID=A0A9P6AGI8_9AGAM|nr:hypothetical protein BS47DRAFT_1368255 [Hydnum rufescens UP504]